MFTSHRVSQRRLTSLAAGGHVHSGQDALQVPQLDGLGGVGRAGGLRGRGGGGGGGGRGGGCGSGRRGDGSGGHLRGADPAGGRGGSGGRGCGRTGKKTSERKRQLKSPGNEINIYA